MIYLFLVLSIFIIVFSNILKIYRLALFINEYEKPKLDILTRALSICNIINFFVPFRLGYIERIWHSGKETKYGKSFLLATIFVEIMIDFLCVLFIYTIFSISGINSKSSLIFYLIALLIVFLISIFIYWFKEYNKKIICKFSQFFNESIELKILKSAWFTIVSFENIVKKVNKMKLLFYSIAIWCLNIISCYFLSLSLKEISSIEIFNLFYSNDGIKTSPLFGIINYDSKWIVIIYFIVSNIILYLVSFALKNKSKGKKKYPELLPHINPNDRLNFLKLYFDNNDKSKYFNHYLELNNDIAIIEDFSAGSNATTMLCSKEGKIFYRKYSFGKDADKLYDQIVWIHNHEKELTLTKIINECYENGICLYDMPYVQGAVTCFNYVHTTPFDKAWKNIKNALDDINKNLHSKNRRPADRETIEQYVELKVLKNIEKIEKGEYIKPLLKYKYIYINGKKYHNLNYFKKYLNKEYLYRVFKNDYYSDIHGDFTIENIICTKDKIKGKNFYIIDPNTGNLHDSPYLDYGKLFQSIHGGYEFLMNTKKVSYEEDKIEFLFTKSSTYYKLFDKVMEYLKSKFGEEGLKSIFYHEVIHWLRLMPYKIEKNGERSLLFYAGLIMVLTDVEERFEKNETSIV